MIEMQYLELINRNRVESDGSPPTFVMYPPDTFYEYHCVILTLLFLQSVKGEFANRSRRYMAVSKQSYTK